MAGEKIDSCYPKKKKLVKENATDSAKSDFHYYNFYTSLTATVLNANSASWFEKYLEKIMAEK